MTELELLAPARNADIGIAAIDCGADAVYIAGPEFGARQSAGNSMEDVRRLCDYAHGFGVRIFLTLNTILYDNELHAAENLLKEAAAAGVDAAIAQDLAVFEILRCAQNDKHAQGPRRLVSFVEPPEVHASTQCAIRTPEQAKFYENLGAKRLVLERQLSLEQIRAIRQAVDCELEFFVHGALCVCYSGQCYMSEAIEGRSANRGACIQACRSLYDLVDGNGKTLVKDKALLSLKDYNLLGRLEDLAESGICSFKIEGRLKNISYVRNVVRAYSIALDELVRKHPERYRRASFGKVEGGFKPDLGKTFNRGYTELFLDGRRGRWSSMDAPKSVGEPIGTVTAIRQGDPRAKNIVYPKSSESMQVYVSFDNPATVLRNGDGFSFISKDHNSIVGFRGDTCRGAMINTKTVPGLYVGAKLYRNLDTAFEKEIEANLPKRLIPVAVHCSVRTVPEYLIIVKAVSQDGRTVQFEMEAGNQEAKDAGRMKAVFASQIGKVTGRYSFSLEDIDTEASGGSLPFLPASAINGIRREVAARLDRSFADGDRSFANALRQAQGRPQDDNKSEEAPARITWPVSYKSNVANKVAERMYREMGAESVEPAFEISHKKEAELMRTKYCIRHELGLCLKDPSLSLRMTTDNSSLRMTTGNSGARVTAAGPLYLVNNGKRYRLGFDCSFCEMTVSRS